jgi:2'-5' RNA ligase
MNVRYHLWLKPSRGASGQFGDVIQQLALELDAPIFEPHITLLGHLNGSEPEHVAKSKELALHLRPFPIIVSRPGFGEDYFHCVFLVVHMTLPLFDAHALARRIFHQEGDGRFLPHLSLLYGQYSENRKKDIIAKLPASLSLPFEATHLSLIRSRSEDPKDWEEMWTDMMGNDRSNERSSQG